MEPHLPLAEADRTVVTAQLGRLSYAPLRVLSRCPAGYPQGVVSFAGPGRGPSTNIYWLSCPHLVKQVDRLEARGIIRVLEGQIRSDPDRAARLARDQAAYIQDVELLRSSLPSGSPCPRPGHGIGGVRDLTRIKCLHAHLAFWLVHPGGEVGSWVMEELARNGPREDVLLCPSHRCPGL